MNLHCAQTGLRRLTWSWLIALACTIPLPRTWAQVDTGAILGRVTDQTGAGIANAKIGLVNEATHWSLQAVSDATGNYGFSALHAGAYSLTATAPGFGTQTRSHLNIEVQQQAQINFALPTAAVTETIDVTDQQPVLDTEDASVGQVVGSKVIQALPLNGRNYTFLAQLSAGVVGAQQDTRGESAHGRFSANGVRATENSYLLDGMDNSSSVIAHTNGKDYVIMTPIDALEEFKIQVSDYSAEFGRAAGAVLNAVTKSGTNQLHGDAWEFFRNDKLNASDYFQNTTGTPKGKYHLNQFGFTLGGPVVIPHLYSGINRSFFFADYEGTRIDQATVTRASVPTLAERNSGYTDLSDLIANQTGTTKDALGRTFPLGTIFDPTTTRIANGSYVRDPFPGNVILSSRLDPNAIKLLNLLPAPNLPGLVSNYSVDPVRPDNIDAFDIRIDQILSQKDQIFGRYSGSNEYWTYAVPFSGYASNNQIINDHSQNIIVAETHTFSPELLNVFRAGINKEDALWTPANSDEMGIPAEFGIQGIPQIATNGGLPYMVISGLNSFGSTTYSPGLKYGFTPQITDDLTWTLKGHHTLKMGATGQRVGYPFNEPPYSRGELAYSGAYTSTPATTDSSTARAQFLLNPSQNQNYGASTVYFSNFLPINQDNYFYYMGLYAQDDWRASQRLTVNLGLRWDRYTAPTEKLARYANFVPNADWSGGTFYIPNNQANLLPAGFVSTLNTQKVNVQTTGSQLVSTAMGHIEPRIGVNYEITSKLLVRAGYGLFYAGFEDLGGLILSENFPFQYSLSQTAVSSHTPLTSDGSIGSLETSFANFPLDPSLVKTNSVTLYGWPLNFSPAHTQSYNAAVQYEMAQNTSLTVGYVGSVAGGIPSSTSGNPILTMLPPGTSTINYRAFPGLGTGSSYVHMDATSNYNSLQATIEHQYSHGLSILGNFTWQKTLTDARDPLENDIGSYRAAQLAGFGIRGDRGRADFDVKRVLHVSGLYEIPYGSNRGFGADAPRLLQAVLGDWDLSANLVLEDGNPFTVGCATATSASYGCNAVLVPGQNPYAHSSVSHFLNAAAFATPAPATSIGQTDLTPLGGVPTQVSGPPARRLNASLMKQLHFYERLSGELRLDAFNVTNTPIFALPGSLNYLNTVTFAQITATRDSPNDPRELQVAMKLRW